MAGRPSKYNLELCKEVCEQVAEGKNIKTVLNSKNEYPSFQTWCNWKRKHDELFDLYVNAIQDKSEAVLFEIDEICSELRKGILEPSVANVLIQTLKWKASKFYPKMFGDKSNVDLTSRGKKIQPPIIQFQKFNKELSPEEIRRRSKELDDEFITGETD